MSLSLRSTAVAWLAAAALCGPCLLGCGGTDRPSDLNQNGVPGVDASLSFAHEGALTMAPGEKVEVVVKGTPPAPYAMTFFLSGAKLDASLDKAKTVADDDGVASVTLRAPNAATSFSLRATIKDGPSADLTVAVSDQGFGNLQIEPVYYGNRPVESWRAHVLTGSCDNLEEALPELPAGALEASAPVDEELFVEDAPVGPNLAVVVTAGGFAWGCSDEAGLVANATTEVTVTVSNKPIVYDDAQLDIVLDLVPEQPAWDNLLAIEMLSFKDAFFSMGQGPAASLLNAMQAASNDPNGFQDAAANNGWEVAMAQHLVSNAVDLDGTLHALAMTGLAQQQPVLLGHFGDVHESGDYGTFEWLAIGGIDASLLGAETSYPMTLSTDPNDTVHFSVQLNVLPSRLIGAAIEQAGTQQYNAVDAVAVLAQTAQCDTLHLEGMEGCSESCIAQLCRDALQSMWAQGLEASAASYGTGTMPIQVLGAAQLDDDARLIGFEGNWLGNVSAGQNQVGVSGTAAGAADVPAAE